MKKVLFVATVTGHINAFHIPYLKWFKEQGYEVHVASNGLEEIPYCDKHFNLNFARFPIKMQNWKVYKQLKKIIEENQYEIIHCHTPVGGVLARLAARKSRKKYNTKVIYTAHGFHFYKGAPKINWVIYYPIEKWMSKYTDCLITINEEDYNRSNKKFKAKKTELVYGVGVDKDKFDFNLSEEQSKELRNELGLKENDFVLIQVGELNKNKNQIMTINTMKEITQEHPNIHLLIVGSGSLENYYREKIEEYNLQQNVHMLGYRNDVKNLLQISDMLISSSYREGLPVNVIEALTAKIPAVVTNCRGNRDLIEDGKNGYIVEIDNIDELKKRILDVYNKQLKFYDNSAEKCKLENVIKEYEKIYKEVEKNGK